MIVDNRLLHFGGNPPGGFRYPPGGYASVLLDQRQREIDRQGHLDAARVDPEFDPENKDGDSPMVSTYRLAQNYPNPFNPNTTIIYQIPVAGHVDLRIYDVKGGLVRTLVDTPKGAGLHVTDWNGKDNMGRSVASGIYFYRIKSGDFVQTKKMVLLK